jgi:hypothetical protein
MNTKPAASCLHIKRKDYASQDEYRKAYLREYRKRTYHKYKKTHYCRSESLTHWEIWTPGSIANCRAPRQVAFLLGFTMAQAEAYAQQHYHPRAWVEFDTNHWYKPHFNNGVGRLPVVRRPVPYAEMRGYE